MKTTFMLSIHDADLHLCDSIAQACIEQIDAIEHSLSRYIESSEIWQINNMRAGETLLLSDLCYDCLRVALDAHEETEGLFDITLGKLIEHQKKAVKGPAPPLTGQLMIDPERPAIHCIHPGREIDLGGIGKGYALDRIRELMEDYGVRSAQLAAGSSTQLAFGSESWPIQLLGENSIRTIDLKDQALSASGTAIQGSHIVSPLKTDQTAPNRRIWVMHQSAAIADAWSTAALLMEKADASRFNTIIKNAYIERGEGIIPLEEAYLNASGGA